MSWVFDRASTAYKTFSNAYENTSPSHSMDLVADDIPRVGGAGSGLLIEGSTIQLHGLTEAFSGWVESGTCAVTADDYVAPNGTLTADLVDNTGGANTDNRAATSANLGDLTDKTFFGSSWIRADTPHNCTIELSEQGVGITTETHYVTKGWNRYTVIRTCAGGGTGLLTHRIHPGEDSVATGAAHFWGANLTETTFATSYIPNAGLVASQATREADDMTLDPHVAGSTDIILPEFFTPAGPANKLTVYGEFKCEYSGVADVGENRDLLEISGNIGTAGWDTNRIMFQVNSNGRIYTNFRDNASNQRNAYSAIDVVDYSKWFSIRFVVDMADLSRMAMWINDTPAAGYTLNSGTNTFDTTNTLIRLGQTYADVVTGFCHIRNLRIYNSEVRP